MERLDKTNKEFRNHFLHNKKKIMATQSICGICGNPVDKSLPYPNPMCATIDHIIPINKGGHPFDIDNLQLAHFSCNRQKSDKLFDTTQRKSKEELKFIGNQNLPLSVDWLTY